MPCAVCRRFFVFRMSNAVNWVLAGHRGRRALKVKSRRNISPLKSREMLPKHGRIPSRIVPRSQGPRSLMASKQYEVLDPLPSNSKHDQTAQRKGIKE